MNEEKTTFTFKEQTGFGIARSDIELTTGKVIVNDIEITSVEDWERVTNSLIKLQNNWNELKEIEKEHQKINGELREENKKLKEVIDEAREYVEKDIYYCLASGDNINVYLDNLLQILDKVKEVK